jgi:HK97 family phage portal protein
VGFFSDIARAIGRKTEPLSGLAMQVRPYGQPPRRGTAERLLAYRTRPWLRAIGGKISNRVAAVPWVLKRRKGRSLDEVLEHPLLDLLSRPNPHLTGRGVRQATSLHVELAGEAFWILERNALGQPVELYPTPPNWVVEVPSRMRAGFRLSYGDLHRDVPESDVIWIRDVDPLQPYGRGAGIAEALGDELDINEYASKQIAGYFFNGATPEFIVSAKGMSKDQATGLKERWENEHRGFWNRARAFFTGADDLKVNRLDTTFRDSQLVELMAANRDTIVSVFGVPPEVLGIIENSNRATIEAASYLLATEVLVPRLDLLRDTLQERLVPMFGADLVLEYVSPVPEDKAFRKEVMSSRPEAFKHNEVRALAGLPPEDGMDVFPEPEAFGGALAKEPEWARALRRVHRAPPAADGGSMADVDRALEALRPERLTTETDPVFRDRIEKWSKRILEELGQSSKFDLLNPLIPSFLENQSADRIGGLVDETTRTALRESLTEGVRAGESIDDLAVRIEDTFADADQRRSELIARTEVLRSSNWATREAQKVSGVVTARKWVSTRDGRTRETHKALDGQKRGIDEAFEVDGKQALTPGDFGDPAEDCNCRCTTVAEISDEELEGVELAAVGENATTEKLDVVWRAYDDGLKPWESEATKALRRGFRSQRNDVLKALRGNA